MVNFYNAITENEQLDVLRNLFELFEESETNPKKLLIAGDFNVFLHLKLDAQGGNPTLKNEHLAKLIEFKEIYELCDIGRVRNTNSKWFTYIKKHSSDFIQHKLNYILVLKTLQKILTMAKIMAPI